MYVATALIRMYAKCGSMVNARLVFDSVRRPDVVCWTTLLLGYAENGEGYLALELFSEMEASLRRPPDCVTYIAALKACMALAADGDKHGKAECLRHGRRIHSRIAGHMSKSLQTTLVGMYAKCGDMPEARRVFDSIREPDVVSWNTLIMGYADNGEGCIALHLFSRMKAESRCVANSVTYVAALKACAFLARSGRREEFLEQGRAIHSQIGSCLNHYVQNTLIDMYAKCGSMADARTVFDSMHSPDVVSWNALILGYAENNEGHAALDMYSRMQSAHARPDSVTYIGALKACASLAASGAEENLLGRSKEIHMQIGVHMNHYVHNMLIDVYGKCGSMLDARQVFDSMREPDVVSWNSLILGYAQNGEQRVALRLFSSMKCFKKGCEPNSVTYIAALRACTSLAVSGYEGAKEECLQRGRLIHSQIGDHLNQYAQNTLVDMYSACGCMSEAHRVFESIQNPDVVSWNALMLGYAENGEGYAALELFSRMRSTRGCHPDSVTYIAALKSCGLVGALALGRKLHSDMSEVNARVVTCLVDFYAKCGSIVEACEVFELHSRERDVSAWTALLQGYGSCGDAASVFRIMEALKGVGFQPDGVTFLCVLSCCNHAGLLGKAREYFEMMRQGSGSIPTVAHYTCMVDALGRANLLNEAAELVQVMHVKPNAVTWMTLLAACHKWKDAEIGRLAFQSLVAIDKMNASAYVLMANLYGSTGMHEEQEWVLETARKRCQEDDECSSSVEFRV